MRADLGIFAVGWLSGCSEWGIKEDLPPEGGAAPDIEVVPERIDFGDLAYGTAATSPLTVTNAGDAPLSVAGLALSLGEAYALSSPAVPISLDPGESVSVDVAYVAGTTESLDTLRVASDDPLTPQIDVPLTGGVLLPEIRILPDPVDFGPVTAGCEAIADVEIHNVGSAPATLDGLIVDEGTFSVLPLGASALDPGGSLPAQILFSPAWEGTFQGQLLASAGPPTTTTAAQIAGTGEAFAVVGPSALAFGELQPTCSADREAVVGIDATCPREIEIAITGPGFAPGDAFVAALTAEPGVEWSVPVRFAPEELGAYAGAIEITDLATGQITAIDLTGDAAIPTRTDPFLAIGPATAPVYLHSSTQLYSYDPTTEALAFVGPTGTTFYDIALDEDANLFGLSSSGGLYQIDPDSGASEFRFQTSSGVGLTILPDGQMIATSGSDVFDIDRTSGATTSLATLPQIASGDIVEVEGELYATTVGDNLVHVDPATGVVTEIGDTTQSGLWGLAYVDGQLIGFASGGDGYVLDIDTGASGAVLDVPGSWYGAAHNPGVGTLPDWTFPLTEPPFDPDTIVVSVDGAGRTDWLYRAAPNEIYFPDPDALDGGETISVTYEILPACP